MSGYELPAISKWRKARHYYFKKTVKQIILNALKKELRKRYAGRFYMKSEFNVIIDENCRYLDKPYYPPFFKAMNFFIGIKMTKKFLNHLLNA